ncbi:MAG: zf-HC2 domain-containing protein [Salinisphaera sp.]|jgi:anti-sigma factor RsiW|nr:zf-HC2 domain-containing protein [Salinisphaera sp.]
MNTTRRTATLSAAHPDDLLSGYIDDELTADQRATVDEHLTVCQRCRRELSMQRSIRDRLAAQPLERASTALRNRIKSQLELDSGNTVSHPRRLWRQKQRALGWAGWAIAACLALALVLNINYGSVSRPQAIPMVASALADYHYQLSAGELPVANSTSIAALQRKVRFRVTPIPSLRKNLIAAWPTHIRGEPAAALAYLFHNRVIVQYLVSEGLFFRQPAVRNAVADKGRYSATVGKDGVVAWPGKDAGSVLIGPMSVQSLVAVSL